MRTHSPSLAVRLVPGREQQMEPDGQRGGRRDLHLVRADQARDRTPEAVIETLPRLGVEEALDAPSRPRLEDVLDGGFGGDRLGAEGLSGQVGDRGAIVAPRDAEPLAKRGEGVRIVQRTRVRFADVDHGRRRLS